MTKFSTQHTDLFASGAPAIVFTEDDQTWTISPRVLVVSSDEGGIYSERDSSALFNNGTILSGAKFGAGVNLVGDNGSVSNAAGGRIVGAGDGIDINGKTATIDNHGLILGLGEIGVDFGAGSDGVTLNNSGTIFGRAEGVRAFSDTDGGVIENSGKIHADGIGIEVFTSTGLTTIINNAAGGTIQGDENSIDVSSGRINLHNDGTLFGDIEVDDELVEKNVIVNHGTIEGDVFFGAGNDVFKGAGGKSGSVFGGVGNDRLIGGDGADHLYGDFGDDRLIGGGGKDWLDGGPGLDVLTGGAGKDQFVFQSELDPALNVDRITDFTVNVDKIVLETFVFQDIGHLGVLEDARFHVGTAAHDADDRIIYNPNNGFLFYDANGDQAGGKAHFATLAPNLHLTHADFLASELLVA